MRILRATEIEHAVALIPLLEKYCQLDHVEYDSLSLLDWIIQYLPGNPYFGLWAVFNEDKKDAVGFMVASVEDDPPMAYCMLNHVYIEKDVQKEVAPKLWEILLDFAKQHQMKEIRAIMAKGIKGAERKYGFKPYKTIVRKVIEDGQQES